MLAKDKELQRNSYDWSEEQVTLSSQNAEIGMAKEEIPVEFRGAHRLRFPLMVVIFPGYSCVTAQATTSMYLKQNGPVVIRQDINPNYA